MARERAGPSGWPWWLERSHRRRQSPGALDSVAYDRDPVFNLDVPATCPDVPNEVLKPRNTWRNGADYDQQAARVAAMFVENFKAFEDGVSADVRAAGPRA